LILVRPGVDTGQRNWLRINDGRGGARARASRSVPVAAARGPCARGRARCWARTPRPELGRRLRMRRAAAGSHPRRRQSRTGRGLPAFRARDRAARHPHAGMRNSRAGSATEEALRARADAPRTERATPGRGHARGARGCGGMARIYREVEVGMSAAIKEENAEAWSALLRYV
jgi:hypothetical protein